MLLLKACPKCKGDVELASDMHGDYVRCLMCGFSRNMPDVARRVDAAPERIELRKAG